MKKVLFLSALALSAMTINAQIELERTLDQCLIQIPETVKVDQITKVYNDLYGYCLVTDTSVAFYNADFESISTLPFDSVYLVSNNLCTTDGKMSFFVARKGRFDNYKPFSTVKLYNEDGDMIFDFGSIQWFGFVVVNEKYKLVTCEYDMVSGGSGYTRYNVKTKIYSLPGNGFPTDTGSPHEPIQKSNTRKLLNHDQVLIERNGVYYNVQGAVVE